MFLVFRQRQLDIARQRPKVNDKVQCVLGASFGEVERSKARKTLGVTEEEIEDDRSKQVDLQFFLFFLCFREI